MESVLLYYFYEKGFFFKRQTAINNFKAGFQYKKYQKSLFKKRTPENMLIFDRF